MAAACNGRKIMKNKCKSISLCIVFVLALRSTMYGSSQESIMNQSSELTIYKGETKEISKGFEITFESHSHKRSFLNGPDSPLIIYMSYRIDNNKDIMIQHNTYPKQGADWGWDWKEYSFVVKEFEYNTSMKLYVRKHDAN